MRTRIGLPLWRTSFAKTQTNTFALERVCCLRVPPLFGHRVGAFHAPCGSSLFCFGCAALRVTVSLQILFGRSARKDFSGPSVNAELRHLGAWPTRSTGAPDQDREIPQTETLMYQNKVTVIRSRWSTLCTPRQQPPDRIQHQRASSFRPRLRRHESQLPGPYRRTRSRPRR